MTTKTHFSDCATHNAPAYERGKCDCGNTPWQVTRAVAQRQLACRVFTAR